MAPFPTDVSDAPSILVSSALAEGAFDPIAYAADKDNKQYQLMDRPLRDTTHHRPPAGHRAIEHQSG